MDSSATGRVIRRAVAGSVLCAGVAAIALRLRTRKRAVVGPETEWSSEQEIRMAEQRDALLGGSRLLGVFDVAAVASLGVWRTAHVRRVLQRVPSLDLPETVRAGAGIILIAVFTHIVLLAALEVTVQAAGWGLRAGLAGASLIVLWRPEALAAAWKDKAERRVSLR